MRTTINIPDHLLIEAKKLAAQRRISLTSVLEEGLRRYLAEERASQTLHPHENALPVLTDPRPVAGIDLDDTSQLMEIS